MLRKKHCLFFWVVLAFVPALCFSDCFTTYGHGYCTDYIPTKTGGKAQSGDAKYWCGNISSSDVAAGDVAIFVNDKYGHVAYIENVNRDGTGKPSSVELSEWNYGSKYNSPAEEACGKTNEFFNTHTPHRVVSVGSVTRFWRPTTSGCGSTSSTSSILLNVDPQATPVTPRVPLAPDAYCKVYASNFMVERFRNASSGKLVVNMTPTDGKMYYYADMSCRLAYYQIRTGEIGIGSGVGAEPPRSAHSSSGKNAGDLADLKVKDLYVVATEGDRTALTQLRVNKTYFCALQI